MVGAGDWPPGPTWCCRNAEKTEISLDAVSEYTFLRFRVDVSVAFWVFSYHLCALVVVSVQLCTGNLVGELIWLKNNPFFPLLFLITVVSKQLRVGRDNSLIQLCH